jgi:hypothetical protein
MDVDREIEKEERYLINREQRPSGRRGQKATTTTTNTTTTTIIQHRQQQKRSKVVVHAAFMPRGRYASAIEYRKANDYACLFKIIV